MTGRPAYGEEPYAQSIARDHHRDGQRFSLDGWSNVDWGRDRPDVVPSRNEAEQDT